jgi:hypothetical protein
MGIVQWFKRRESVELHPDKLSTTVLRIASLRDKHEDKTGIVEKMAAKVRTRWDYFVGFQVANLRENGRIETGIV